MRAVAFDGLNSLKGPRRRTQLPLAGTDPLPNRYGRLSEYPNLRLMCLAETGTRVPVPSLLPPTCTQKRSLFELTHWAAARRLL